MLIKLYYFSILIGYSKVSTDISTLNKISDLLLRIIFMLFVCDDAKDS